MSAKGMRAFAYGAAQAARASWFWAHYAMAQRVAPPIEGAPQGRLPSQAEILEDLAALFRSDWSNIARGIYPAPGILPGPVRLFRRSRAFFADLVEVNARRREHRTADVFAPPHHGRYPRYYLQNFHFQTGGYLSAKSAQLYDYQVEVLFSGGADAMRRQALVPIAHLLRTLPVRGVRLLDVGCGTGRFLALAMDAHPRLESLGIDLSDPYLAYARRALRRWSRARLAIANAEAIPARDASFDIVTCLYLFHELPPRVRRIVASEIARVLRPGGLFVFVDSIQPSDHPPYNGLLRRFPMAFHEPYYASYLDEDLVGLFAEVDMEILERRRAFFSTVIALRRAG